MKVCIVSPTLLLALLLLISVCKASSESQRRRLISREDLVKKATALAEASHEPHRPHTLKKVLTQASGIYTDKSKVKSPRLENTILLNVVESNAKLDPEAVARYREQLFNHLCYTKSLGLTTVVYLIKENQAKFESDSKELLAVDPNLKILEYPYELFWRNIARKSQDARFGGGRVDYEGDIPSYGHFGFLVTLIPILEALLNGFNVMYFDVDIAFVKDPLPNMLTGEADFIVSPEMRSCVYPSLYENRQKLDYNNYESNTGTMHVRSNQRTIKLFQAWIDEIVKENANNDQKALHFKAWGAKQTYDCNDHAHYSLPARPVPDPHAPRFCFLNELLFQNGKLAFNCAFDKFGSRSELMLAMASMRYDGYGATPPPEWSRNRDVLHDIPLLKKQAAANKHLAISPVTVHANFCDDKVHCLNSLNLWLIQRNITTPLGSTTPVITHSCKAYDFSETFFGQIDWQKEVSTIEREAQEMDLKNGTVYRLQNRKRIFLIGDGAIHEFYDVETMNKYGHKMEDVVTLKPFSYFMNYTTGRLIGD